MVPSLSLVYRRYFLVKYWSFSLTVVLQIVVILVCSGNEVGWTLYSTILADLSAQFGCVLILRYSVGQPHTQAED